LQHSPKHPFTRKAETESFIGSGFGLSLPRGFGLRSLRAVNLSHGGQNNGRLTHHTMMTLDREPGAWVPGCLNSETGGNVHLIHGLRSNGPDRLVAPGLSIQHPQPVKETE